MYCPAETFPCADFAVFQLMVAMDVVRMVLVMVMAAELAFPRNVIHLDKRVYQSEHHLLMVA